jgi:SAM-dependent methyltransferase
MKTLKSLTIFYEKLSTFGKILLFIGLLLVVIVFFKSIMPITEGMTSSKDFLFKQGDDVYDDFYANIYDYLVFSDIKNDYEVGTIINNTSPSSTSVIADIGCGTGHHTANLSEKNLKVIGVDISPSMIKKAKKNFPNANFQVGDALDNGLFKMQSLTHILCLYFTIYSHNCFPSDIHSISDQNFSL